MVIEYWYSKLYSAGIEHIVRARTEKELLAMLAIQPRHLFSKPKQASILYDDTLNLINKCLEGQPANWEN